MATAMVFSVFGLFEPSTTIDFNGLDSIFGSVSISMLHLIFRLNLRATLPIIYFIKLSFSKAPATNKSSCSSLQIFKIVSTVSPSFQISFELFNKLYFSKYSLIVLTSSSLLFPT